MTKLGHVKRGAVHWRHLRAPARLKHSKGGSGGAGEPAQWYVRCGLNWRCARAATAALLAAWIVAMNVFEPYPSALGGGLQTGGRELQPALPSVGRPGICTAITGIRTHKPPQNGQAASFRQQHEHSISCTQPAPLLVVLVMEYAAAAAACARATIAAQTLKRRQTLGCFDVALLVIKHERGDGIMAPGHSSCPGLRTLDDTTTYMLSPDFVVFIAVHKDEMGDRLRPAALEKMVLAAQGEDADVVSITPDAHQSVYIGSNGNSVSKPTSTFCIERRREEDGEAGRRNTRRRPSIICRGAGAPVLLRVPRWLPAPKLKVWAAAVADTIGAPLPSFAPASSWKNAQRLDDGLAALFCVGSHGKGITTHVLREQQSLRAAHQHHVSNIEGVDGAPLDIVIRWCDRVEKPAAKQRTRATDETRPYDDLGEIREPGMVIANAYNARAYMSKNDDALVAPAPKNGLNVHGRASLGSFEAAASAAAAAAPGFMLVVPWLEHGGADQFNVNLARELTLLGVRVVVVTTLSSAHPTAPDFYAITPDIFHLPQLIASPHDTARVLEVLAYLVTSRGVEVVMVSHSAFGYELLPSFRSAVEARRGHRSGVKFVDYVHLEEMEWGNGGYAATSVAQSRHLDHTFVASKHVAAWMRSRAAGGGAVGLSVPPDSPSRVSLAYIGVDTKSLRPMRPRARLVARQELFKGYAVTPSVPVIVYLARMVDQKLPELYFEIIRQLREERRVEFASVAIGGGPKLDELRANLSRLRPDVERYGSGRQQQAPHLALGMLNHDAAVRAVAASDILLLPSRNEGIALAAYEAMALGVTPVVSAVGGQCELVSSGAGACVSFERGGGGGLLADPNGPLSPENLTDAATAFVDELERLITSPKLLKKRQREARQTVEEGFDMQHTVRALARGLQCTGGL